MTIIDHTADFAARRTRRDEAFERLRPVNASECANAPERDYLIKGLLSAGDTGLLIGAPGSGKSILAPHMAWSVATGSEFFGRKVRQAPVLYIAAEDGHGLAERVAAMVQAHGPADDLLIIPASVNLLDDEGDVFALAKHTTALRPGLVVVDTVAATFPGTRENEAEAMDRVWRGLAGMHICAERDGWPMAVLAVHHTPKAGDTPRGHGLLFGAADVVLLVEGEGTGPRSVSAKKNRSGPSGPLFSFGLALHDIGTDRDGDPRLRPIVGLEAVPTAPKPEVLSPRQRTALGFLRDVALKQGQPLPSGWRMPADLRGVPFDAWQAECDSRRLVQSDDAKNRRDVFRRVASELRDRRAVAFRDETVWIAAKEGALR